MVAFPAPAGLIPAGGNYDHSWDVFLQPTQIVPTEFYESVILNVATAAGTCEDAAIGSADRRKYLFCILPKYECR